MPEITIPAGAETEPDIPIRIDGVDHSIRVGVQTTVTDAVYDVLSQSFYADDIVVHEDQGGGGDFLDTQMVTSVTTPVEGSVLPTTGYSNGTLLILGQGACADGTSWLGGQIEALACQDGNGMGRRLLVFCVLGAIPDAGWEKMTINGTEFLRADALYNNMSGAAGLWQWSGEAPDGITPDPFEEGSGNVVTWE